MSHPLLQDQSCVRVEEIENNGREQESPLRKNSLSAAREADVSSFHDGCAKFEKELSLGPTDSNAPDDIYISLHGGAVGASWRYKLPVMLCILFLTFGDTYSSSTLPPLKVYIMKNTYNDGIPTNAARFGTIASSSHLINAILPIVSGVIIDYYGVSFTSLICTALMLVGDIVRAVGAQRGSFAIILGGEIISGVGSTSINTCQSKLYSHWFRGTPEGGPGLIGFISGLDISMNRIFGLIAAQTAIPLFDATGEWYWAFWLGAIFSALAFVLNIIYVILERHLPKEMHLPSGRRQNPVRGNLWCRIKTHIVHIGKSIVMLPASFWLLAILQILQAGAVTSYTSNLADVVRVTRNTTPARAGWTSGIDYIMPIVLTPVFGGIFDYTGRRPLYISYTAALYVLVFALLAYTKVHELVPIILGSLAFCSNALPFIASIPLLVPSQALIGTAFGVWKAFNSAGSTIMTISTGAIQDLHRDNNERQYDEVFYFLIALKAVDVIIGLTYGFLDRRYFGRVMSMTEKQRVMVEAEETEKDRLQGLRGPKRSMMIIGCSIVSALIIVAYVLYIYYSVVNKSAKPG